MNQYRPDSEGGNPRLGEAAAWQIRLTADDATESDFLLAFEAWIADPQARAAYDAVEMVNADVTEFRDTIATALRAADRPAIAPSKPSRKFSFRMAGFGLVAAAASVALAIIVAPQVSPQWTTYTTPKGATRAVQLADGSVITLNTDSSVKVSLNWLERKAVMAEGEASFVVAGDSRPFSVDVGDRRVRDIGTEFSIRNYQGRGMVTVKTGLVDVSPLAGGPAARLAAGDQLIWEGGRDYRRKADVEAAFAWQSGRLIYSGAKLADLAADLNRYFPRPIEVVGAAADYEFSGVLTLDTEEQVVTRLQAFLPITAQEAEGRITLSAKPGAPAPN